MTFEKKVPIDGSNLCEKFFACYCFLCILLEQKPQPKLLNLRFVSLSFNKDAVKEVKTTEINKLLIILKNIK